MTGQAPLANVLDGLIRAINWLSKACGIIAALLLVIACLVVCQMVAFRYLLEVSTIWQTEVVIFCVVGATLIGSPYVLQLHGHVNVDLLPQRLPGNIRYWFSLTTSIIAASVCVILTWSGGKYFLEAWQHGWVTESVWGPPLWIPLSALPLGLGILTLQYIAESLELLKQAIGSVPTCPTDKDQT